MKCPVTNRACDCAHQSVKHRACVNAAVQVIRELDRKPHRNWQKKAHTLRKRVEER